MKLEDDSLGELDVTATFTDEDVETVIFVVCEIVGAGCAREDGRFRIGVGPLDVLRPVTRLAVTRAEIQ